MTQYTIPLSELGMNDVPVVGGKNASLGEMIHHLEGLGVSVPGGFATTADAYREFLSNSGLTQRISERLADLDVSDIVMLQRAGSDIRGWIMQVSFPDELDAAINHSWQRLVDTYGEDTSYAVRSSATAEDLPDASFAGQQETYLNVSGLDEVKLKIREVFASLYNDRAIAYRVHQGFAHDDVALSAGIQKMVRSDIGTSGVMFTLDTESGFRDAVFITGSYGLGEMVVQGAVNPDEFYVHKVNLLNDRPAVLRRNLGSKAEQMIYADADSDELVEIVPVNELQQRQYCLNDDEVMKLARMAVTIEEHYGVPMDIEWAKDGNDNKLYIVQARPETVQSRSRNIIEKYELLERGDVLAEGRAIGGRIGKGRVRLFRDLSGMEEFNEGDVLLTDMTDPDWEPVMKKAAAIITNRGGRTCHAAIIARELGVPAVVGCGDATETISDSEAVTVSCAEGDAGFVYQGQLEFRHTEQSVEKMPELPLKIMMNVGNPDRAFDFAQLPNQGVGLARLEFIINNMIGIHPKALIHSDSMEGDVRKAIEERATAYGSPVNFFVDKLVEGVSSIAAAFYPTTVIVRMSDFKSNEYANLIGGKLYEPEEENPMIGFRGASRYVSEAFAECFALECKAMKHVRDVMGYTNVQLMIPFVRTVNEASAVIEALAANGLVRGENDLKIMMMCELPSNAVNAEAFLEHFDGFSIGSNDMTQLTLGLDRDSALVAEHFDERDPAVYKMLQLAIEACHRQNKYVGICGQGPSDHDDLAQWLLDQGISSISLNPDTVVDTWLKLAQDI